MSNSRSSLLADDLIDEHEPVALQYRQIDCLPVGGQGDKGRMGRINHVHAPAFGQ